MLASNSAGASKSASVLILQMGALIFAAEGLIMLVMNGSHPDSAALLEALIDAAALTAIVSPISYWYLVKPFERRATAALAASRSQAEKLANTLADLKVQKSILDHHCLVSKTDVRGRITYANEEFSRVSGFTADELIGQNHRIINSGFHPTEFWRDMYQDLARTGIWQGQACNRAKDGTQYWVQATNVSEKDASGKLIGYISVRSNITQTKKREQELSAAQADLQIAMERAEAANRAKSGFLSTMSHEMRTPLNGVIGSLELLRTEALTPSQKDLVSIAAQSSEALLVHINDVLDFSKMEAGKLDLVVAPLCVRHLMKSVADIVSPVSKSRRNEVVVEIGEGMPEWVIGDVDRLRQILLNFASNAVKFTESGRVTISAHIELEDDDAASITFAVTDTGPGIPEGRRGELFREFSMLDATFARKAGGTGLGLAISKNLVKAMAGEIGVDTQEGVGSRFWFRVRLTRCENPQMRLAARPGSASQPQVKLRILLVDDSTTNRVVGSRLIASAGHDVVLASGGSEALTLSRATRFDVILMDISMPDMDGLEATQLIREQSPLNRETPIVALTAHAVTGDRERFLAGGMTAYLSKPLRLAALVACLETLHAPGQNSSVVA